MTALSAFCAPRRLTHVKGLALGVSLAAALTPLPALGAPSDPPVRVGRPYDGGAIGQVISEPRESDAAPPPQPQPGSPASMPPEPPPAPNDTLAEGDAAAAPAAPLAEEAPPIDAAAPPAALDPAAPAAAAESAPLAPDDAAAPGQLTEDDGTGRRRHRAQQLRVAVVPVRRFLPRSFDIQVANELMEPLVHKVELVPLQQVRQAVGRMHVTPDQLHLPASLRTLGRRLNADFVMLVEPAGRRSAPHLFVALVDVHSGETPVAKRMPLPRGRVRPGHAQAVMPQILAALEAAMPQEAPIEPEVVPPPAAAEEPAAPLSDKDKDKGKEDVEAAPAAAAADSEQTYDIPDLAHLRLGLALMQRVGHLVDTQNSGVVPPQYAGTNNNSNPFFPAFALEGRIYSGIAHKSRRKWYDGFGIALDLQITAVNSYTDDDTSSKIASKITKLDAFAVYRALVLPHKELSPMAELGVGIDTFSFPLKGAEYPGVAFRAPLIRLDLTFPVHRFIWLNAHAGVMPGATTGSDAGTVLGKVSKGLGYVAGGGVAGRYRIFTGQVAFDYQRYAMSFTGQTTLAETVTLSDGSQAQFTNIKLTDSLKEIKLLVGVMY